jgi:hypothetical protein
MPDTTEVFANVRAQAFARLSLPQRTTTNLYLDQRIYQKGDCLGPPFQKTVVTKPSILVFADDHPRANSGMTAAICCTIPTPGTCLRRFRRDFPPMS